MIGSTIKVFHSAVARFYAPSNMCGAGGMYQERIRSTPSWNDGPPRRDTAFVELDSDQPGMLGMGVGRVLMFFSFKYMGKTYPCALVRWLMPVGYEPDDETGLWVVRPETEPNGRPSIAVVHLDCIPRAAHLIPKFGSSILPDEVTFTSSLDIFHSYFVNAYADHHMHEFLSVDAQLE